MNRISFVLLSLWVGGAGAGGFIEDKFKGPQFEYDFDADVRPWQEVQAQLPGVPKPESLREFVVGGGRGHHYFLDPASLTSGEDGVVRYTVVIRTAGGAENVSYEGMRCTDGERKIYAFGRPDGQWSRNRYARWDPIEARSETSYHKELFFHYFCTVDGAGDLKLIRHAIERGGIRRGGD
ncbi:MAG: CNP1-like family protein [Hydrogenophilaceae bacterium]